MKLGDEGRNQAHATDDGVKRKSIFDAVDELERLLPLHMASAREAVAQPKDKAKQAKLEEMSERLKDVADAVLTAMADNADEAAASAANQQAKEVERLSSAARAGDAHAVEMAAKALAKKQPKLAQQARARAAKTDDPERKRDILDALEMLEALIPGQIRAAKDATSDPDDAQKRQLLNDVRQRPFIDYFLSLLPWTSFSPQPCRRATDQRGARGRVPAALGGHAAHRWRARPRGGRRQGEPGHGAGTPTRLVQSSRVGVRMAHVFLFLFLFPFSIFHFPFSSSVRRSKRATPRRARPVSTSWRTP